jgi:hypothetical protein
MSLTSVSPASSRPVELLNEHFADFEIGPLPYDYSPLGEYHYKPPVGYTGSWYEPTNRGWRLGAHWVVLEEDGKNFLEQSTNTQYRSMLVAGESDWQDYELSIWVRPLLTSGEAGGLVRYQSGRAHLEFVVAEGKYARLIRVDHEQREVLSEAPFAYSCDQTYRLTVRAVVNSLDCFIDGMPVLSAVVDQSYRAGRIGLVATVPAQYFAVTVTTSPMTHAFYLNTQRAEERQLNEVRSTYPQPHLWRKISLKGFGAGRHIRFGDLTGTGSLDMVVAQNIKHTGIDLYSMISCLTAFDLDGTVLWQYGKPRDTEDAALTTSDLAFQIYDIDGDGCNEVILTHNFQIVILDGRTGRVKKKVPTPRVPDVGKNFFKWPENDFDRINGDVIQICNFSGKNRPSDILVKNRYNWIWAYDSDLNPLWQTHCYTGHFPQAYDFNGDGRDELIACWTLISADGKILWDLGLEDHVDEIAIGHFDPNQPTVQIAVVAGDEGFLIFTPEGKILHQDKLGHAQRLTAAKFRADLPGVQFYVVTYWDNAGIISFHDAAGKKLHSFEPATKGNLLNPVNWTGQGEELALLSGSARHGGLVDGHGRKVVRFPNDGHPELAAEVIDLGGDPRDEIVLWDREKMYIYTQDTPFAGDTIYDPQRYPHYNNSNYRAEISLPRWRKP